MKDLFKALLLSLIRLLIMLQKLTIGLQLDVQQIRHPYS
jgi:hypothetical protein